MKNLYFAIFTPDKKDSLVLVTFPDLDINTEGTSLENALEMAVDALSGIVAMHEEQGKGLPSPSSYQQITAQAPKGAIVQAIMPNPIAMAAYAPKQRVQVMLSAKILAAIDQERKKENLNRSAWLEKAAHTLLG